MELHLRLILAIAAIPVGFSLAVLIFAIVVNITRKRKRNVDTFHDKGTIQITVRTPPTPPPVRPIEHTSQAFIIDDAFFVRDPNGVYQPISQDNL
jgi:hypothetical protein